MLTRICGRGRASAVLRALRALAVPHGSVGRSIVSATLVCRAPAPADDSGVSIGQRLYSLSRHFTTERAQLREDSEECIALALEAWRLLQTVTEADMETMPLRDLTEIVVAYGVFAKSWENGVRGPKQAEVEGAPLEYTIIERPDIASADSSAPGVGVAPVTSASEAPAPRANPLDTVLEF